MTVPRADKTAHSRCPDMVTVVAPSVKCNMIFLWLTTFQQQVIVRSPSLEYRLKMHHRSIPVCHFSKFSSTVMDEGWCLGSDVSRHHFSQTAIKVVINDLNCLWTFHTHFSYQLSHSLFVNYYVHYPEAPGCGLILECYFLSTRENKVKIALLSIPINQINQSNIYIAPIIEGRIWGAGVWVKKVRFKAGLESDKTMSECAQGENSNY